MAAGFRDLSDQIVECSLKEIICLARILLRPAVDRIHLAVAGVLRAICLPAQIE